MDNNEPPKTIEKVVGERVKAARENLGISRNSLAQAVGIPTTTFRDKERGHREFGIAQLVRIEKQLQLEEGTLYQRLAEVA